ncbi:ATP-dependent zinc metalloprotease FtsH [Gossypium australe]|uniref:ATP-dependent zinc metalloprotease FtsH n=1 Tax=Gossypium australe TaxID=47621 RepID=A0A5B6VY34_9ROSI|nr:ATP-dependent zinc metalloprotease FtsH [Gossypium australe]
MIPTEHEKCVRFENRLLFDFKIQVAPHLKWVFETLVEKAKIVEGIKQEKRKVPSKRDFVSTGSKSRPIK